MVKFRLVFLNLSLPALKKHVFFDLRFLTRFLARFLTRSLARFWTRVLGIRKYSVQFYRDRKYSVQFYWYRKFRKNLRKFYKDPYKIILKAFLKGTLITGGRLLTGGGGYVFLVLVSYFLVFRSFC